jgi:phage minor structural protein
MSQIHILDGQTDQILANITDKYIVEDTHTKSLINMLETFDFTTLADKYFSHYLSKNNRIIIPDENGKSVEFVIHDVLKYLEDKIMVDVFSSASYLMLKKAKVIYPEVLQSQTTFSAATFALSNTEWQVGEATFVDSRTFNIDSYTNPYSFLRRIANEFALELRFRVETQGNEIIGRYVDLVENAGEWRGREVTLGKDLIGIKRREKTDGVATALVGVGPEREDGTRLEALVEDKEALERWGRNGQHLIEIYEPESTNEGMTLARLTELTENELQKRVNAMVEYDIDVADLEHVPGMANKQIRFGDTIKIKDQKYNPPLYVEARVFELKRSIVDKSAKRIKLGDFVEYTESEVMDIWRSLQKQIHYKIGQNQLVDYTYDKAAIDYKDTAIYTDSKSYAFTKAQEAEDNAKEHADNEYAPIKNDVEENKDVWNRSGIINEDGTLNTDRLFGELTDDQIESAGKWNGLGTFIDENGVYTGLVVADKITSGTINADDVSISNDKVLINQDGVTVKDADFLIVDSVSGMRSSILNKNNILKDGLFDFIRVNFNEPRSGAGTYVAIGGQSEISGWITYGFPRVVTSYLSDNPKSFSIFGLKTALVNNTNYFEQAFFVPGSADTYTLSFHYAHHASYTAGGSPSIRIEYVGGEYYDVLSSQTFDFPVPNCGVVYRESFTFTPPSSAELVRVIMKTKDSRYLMFDGVQCVLGDTPTSFVSNDDLTYFTHGLNTAEELRTDVLTVGSNAYFDDIEVSGTANINTLRLTGRRGGYLFGSADKPMIYEGLWDGSGTFRSGDLVLQASTVSSDRAIHFGTNTGGKSVQTRMRIQGNQVRVFDNFVVDGSKSASVDTNTYGRRLMYALETPDSRFVSYTEHVLEEGEHFIEIEPMFLETISPTDYFVVPHIQNAAEVVILERKEGEFRVWVQGHTAEVVFEVNGKRRGYEDVYMEESSDPFDESEEGKEEEV